MLVRYLISFCFILSFAVTATTQTRPSSSSAPVTAESVPHSWSFLSLNACGIEDFLKQYPTADGRGTIICVLDDGVDPGVEGLITTSENKPKMFDLQDLAGSGDLLYHDAKRSGDNIIFNEKKVLSGMDKLSVSTYDGKYYYAVLAETRFQNGLKDLNFDEKHNGEFGIVIYQDREGHFSTIVDANANGDVSDEKVLSTYRENKDLFRFRSGEFGGKNDGRYLSGAVTIYPDAKKISLYFADGGHGTHVAGIAAGCSIGGQAGFNGVAPGAEIVGLKFADNTLLGITMSGSMKRAYEYVFALARETGKPVIANMSFGVGSELEGQSEMDVWLDSLLQLHPDVTVCVSAANDGPGLSNIGLPGAAKRVISSGAVLPDDTGRDLYAVKMSKPFVWDFSSRGGEVAKPDIVSPGSAVSTVPDYVLWDRYNGTSMSSPYTAGCCAVLISAMKQMFPDYTPSAHLIKRALQLGAVPIEGQTALDQGGGLINIPRAFELLVKWYRSGTAPRQYDVSVEIPSVVGTGTAAFYRNNNYPRNGERTVFEIKPLAEKQKNRSTMLAFNAFDLRADASWIKPVQSTIYRRGEGALSVSVEYDEKQLEQPGVYFGKILAYRKGSTVKNSSLEFELWNTVIVPHELTNRNNYRTEVRNVLVKPGMLRREFIAVPAGAKGVKFTLTAADGKSEADALVINNDGRTCGRMSLLRTDDKSATLMLTGENMEHGVLEVVIKNGIGSDDDPTNTIHLTVEAFPLTTEIVWSDVDEKGKVTVDYEIQNPSAKDFSVTSELEIAKYEKQILADVNNTDEFTYQFTPRADDAEIEFTIEMSRKDYNRFTDIALQIVKPDGSAAASSAFDQRTESVKLRVPENDTTRYTLRFKGGCAIAFPTDSVSLVITEQRRFKTSQHVRANEKTKYLIRSMGSARDVLHVDRALTPIPSGYLYRGSLFLNIQSAGKIEVPFLLHR